MPGGRPSDYDDSYPDLLIKTMSQGDTLACFCADIGIARDTAYHWMKENPKFSDAFKKGQENALRFWEKMLARCAMGMPIRVDGKEYKNYNITAMIFLMKCRFKDYKEQIQLDVKTMDFSDETSLA